MPHLLKGDFSEGVSTRVDVTRSASRSAWSRSSARSTSRRWCRVVLPDRDRGRQHGRAQAEREGSVGRELARGAVGRGRAAARACSTSCTATRSRSTGCSSTPTSRRSRSSARRRSRGTSTRPRRSAGKRVQALGGAKNHMVVLPDADLDLAADAAVNAGLRFGRRAVHGDLGASSRSAPIADELVAKIAERIGGLTVGDGTPRRRHGTARHRARTSTRSRRTSTRASSAGATLVVDGRDAPDRRRCGRASGSARRCSTTSPPRCRSTPTRSSGRCCRWCASTPTTTRSRW